jgi:predicted dehydrogenase
LSRLRGSQVALRVPQRGDKRALADTVHLDSLQQDAPRLLQGVTLTDKNDMYIDELRDFLAAAATGTFPACTGEDGLHVLAVIDAARRSLADGGRATEPRPEYLR